MGHYEPFSEQFQGTEMTPHTFLASALIDLEKSMRESGYWSDLPPHEKAFESTTPFFCDTMDLDAWLQWVFIPRMKIMIEHEAPLPKASIHEYAEETLGKQENTASIMLAIKTIDHALSGD